MFSSPSQPAATSSLSGNPPPNPPLWPSLNGTRTAAPITQPGLVQPGLVLSPSAEPLPKKLVDKARAGQFMDMKELLTDKVSLINQLEAVHPIHMLGAARPRLREVSTLPTWCYCFIGYMAMCTSDPVTRDQLAYARLIIREAQRHGGPGWLDYDRAFRQQIAADPSLRWNTLLPGLQAATMLGQQAARQGPFCTLCREVDHTRAQCALAYLQPTEPDRETKPPTRRRPATFNTCISWNMGRCVFPGQCTYRHVCATCQQSHRAKDCARTPETSRYKDRTGGPRQQPPTPAHPSRQA